MTMRRLLLVAVVGIAVAGCRAGPQQITDAELGLGPVPASIERSAREQAVAAGRPTEIDRVVGRRFAAWVEYVRLTESSNEPVLERSLGGRPFWYVRYRPASPGPPDTYFAFIEEKTARVVYFSEQPDDDVVFVDPVSDLLRWWK